MTSPIRQCMRTRRFVVSSSYSAERTSACANAYRPTAPGTSRMSPTAVASSSASNSSSPLGPPAPSMIVRSNTGPITAPSASAWFTASDSREQPTTDDFADALGDAEVTHGDVRGPAAVPLDEHAGLGEMAEHLTHEERVAFGLGVQGPGEIEPGLLEVVARGHRHEAGDLVAVEAVQVESLDPGLAAEVGERVRERMAAIEVRVAIRAEHQQPHRRRRTQEVAEQHERRLVGPVDVVEHQHDRLGGRHLGEQIHHRVEQLVALGVGVGAHRLREAGHPRRDLRHDADELAAECADLRAQPVGRSRPGRSDAAPRRRVRTARRALRRIDPTARSNRGRAHRGPLR